MYTLAKRFSQGPPGLVWKRELTTLGVRTDDCALKNPSAINPAMFGRPDEKKMHKCLSQIQSSDPKGYMQELITRCINAFLWPISSFWGEWSLFECRLKLINYYVVVNNGG